MCNQILFLILFFKKDKHEEYRVFADGELRDNIRGWLYCRVPPIETVESFVNKVAEFQMIDYRTLPFFQIDPSLKSGYFYTTECTFVGTNEKAEKKVIRYISDPEYEELTNLFKTNQ